MSSASTEAPMKRRRGRPRKDESQTQPLEKSSPAVRPILRPQGEASSASKGKDTIQADADLSADDDYNNDELVGQVVTGVLECAFDAGYFLRVRVGNSNMYMRGVVFKEGCVVPVTPENDIAPNAKMYKRLDLPIPVSFPPANDVGQKETHAGNVDNLLNVASEKQDDEGQKDTKVSEPGQNCVEVVPKEDNVLNQSEEEKAEIELARNIMKIISGGSNQSEEEIDKIEPSNDVKEREDSFREAVEDLLEPPVKVQKIDIITVTCSNGKPLEELAESEVVIQPELDDSLKEQVGHATVIEQEICGNSGFQISMENTDGDDLVTEPPSEFSAMETEQAEG